jgi:hypothetical protein
MFTFKGTNSYDKLWGSNFRILKVISIWIHITHVKKLKEIKTMISVFIIHVKTQGIVIEVEAVQEGTQGQC